MATGGRAYQTLQSTPIASPGGLLLAIPAGKRIVVVKGWVSVTEVGAADDYIELITSGPSINIFHAPQGAVGVYSFDYGEAGLKLEDGQDISVSITGATGCYVSITYYLESTYLG